MCDELCFEPIADTLPPGFAALLTESEAEGHELLTRFVAALASGAECHDGVTAHFLAVTRQGVLIALGGIAPDHYLTNPAVGRMRHVYVARAFRRSGVGAALVRELLRLGAGFSRVRLRVVRPEAARFYEALGFAPVDGTDATPVISLLPPTNPE
jgi:GNAT superfamily N-acetyltransferase